METSVNEGKEITELSLENSTVLSYQHFQDHFEEFPSIEFQANNVHGSKLQKAPEGRQITKDNVNSSTIKNDALDKLKCIHTNDFVNTQFFKREREKTDEEEMYDPLHIIMPSIKVEPSDADSEVNDEIGLASDFVAVEMKAFKQSNIAIDCDNEMIDCNSKSNLKLEEVLPQTSEIEPFLVMDIKAEIEEFTTNPLQKKFSCGRGNRIYKKRVKKTSKYKERQGTDIVPKKRIFKPKKEYKNSHLTRSRAKFDQTQICIRSERDEIVLKPLHNSSDSSSCDEEADLCPEMLEKRKLRAEINRKNWERRKKKDIERKERLIRMKELGRLKRSRIADEDFPEEDEKDVKAFRLTRSNAKNDGVQQRKRYFVDDDEPDSAVIAKRKILARKMRERRARETPQESEARRLKARIAIMKSRLVARLIKNEEELQAENSQKAKEMILKRKKVIEAETPEQTAARKLKQSLQARWSRNRLEAVETPEETAKRKEIRAAYLKKRNEAKKAKQTPEEKALRKEQRKAEQRLKKEKKQLEKLGLTPKDIESNVSATNTIKAIETQLNGVINDSSTSWDKNNLTQFISKNTFNTDTKSYIEFN